MVRRTLAEVPDKDLHIHPDDEPFVVQMKLLRRDLKVDARERRRFESRVKVAVGVIALALVATVVTWHDTRQADCRLRREGREGARESVVEGGVTSALAGAQALVNVASADASNDPRVARLFAEVEREARTDLQKLVDRELPPVVCG